MSGDPYIKENERLEAEIERLQVDLNFQYERVANKDCEIDRLQVELKKEEKFTMAAMDKAKMYRAALERIADLYGYEAEANAVAIAREALAKEGK